MSLDCGAGPAEDVEEQRPCAILLPVVEGRTIETLPPEVVGDALGVISRKQMEEKDALDDDSLVERNSFWNLHRPDLTYLDWVQESSDTKEEVLLSCALQSLNLLLVKNGT